jgi:hypothetical protein
MFGLDSATVLILLGSCVAMLVFLVFLILKVSWRLSRIELFLAENQFADRVPEVPSLGLEREALGAFQTFLAEDPARGRLTKGEQFAAYRKWRQEKGMNWSNS